MAAPFQPQLPYVAIETSGPAGSVAVAVGGVVKSEFPLPTTGNQSAELIPYIALALSKARVERAEIGGVVVGRGPGSFTGVRIGAATGKGIAHALGVPLWAISSLEAGAANDPLRAPLRYVLFDARDDRVYAACYRAVGQDLETVVAAHATRVADLLEGDGIPTGAVFMGSAALKHEFMLRLRGFAVAAPPAGVPTASALLRLLLSRPDRPTVAPLDPWEPDYVKGSSAVPSRV